MTDWSRLAKLAGMLGSPYDGERLNAARLLDNTMAREGVTFADLSKRIAEGAGGGFAPPRVVYVDREVVRRVYERAKPNPAAEVARKILSRSEEGRRLNYNERRFLRGILSNDDYTGGMFSLSTQQANWLNVLEENWTKPKKVYRPPRSFKPVDESLLDALGLGDGTFEEKEDTEDFVGAFRQRAAGERPRAKAPPPKPQPRAQQGAGNAPGADYRGDFKGDEDDLPF